MLDVQDRYLRLLERRRELRMYALIDGYQYEQHCGRRIELRPAAPNDEGQQVKAC